MNDKYIFDCQLPTVDCQLPTVDCQIEKNAKHEKKEKITVDNIYDYLNDYNLLNKTRKQRFISMVQFQLVTIKKITGRQNKILFAIAIFKCICEYLDVMNNDKTVAKLVITLKAKLHHLIKFECIYELIPIYDEIFNDQLYKDIDVPDDIEIPNEQIDSYIKQYNDALMKYKKKVYKAPQFEKGEVVGAKDKEGNWWMSEVLEIFTYKEHAVYYVKFFGWGDQFNEFITSTRNIKKFNPRKHLYYRPAWKTKKNTLPVD